MRTKFQEQMNEMPAVAQNLKKLEEIPNKLESAVARITQSQERLASDFLTASQKIVNAANKSSVQQSNGVMQAAPVVSPVQIPPTIKWTVIVGIILITLATICNTAYNIWKGETAPVPAAETIEITNDSIATAFPMQVTDSTHVQNQ